MNFNTYIFGVLAEGFTQYPNDYADSVFNSFIEKSTVPTQIVTYRTNNILYYGYVRKLSDTQSIGFCIVVNDVIFKNVNVLFPIFEKAVVQLAENGKILQYNDDGDIEPVIPQFTLEKEEAEMTLGQIRDDIDLLENKCKKLPTLDVSISNYEVRTFNLSNKVRTIDESIAKNGYTVIKKTISFTFRPKKTKKPTPPNDGDNGKKHSTIKKYIVASVTILAIVLLLVYSAQYNINKKTHANTTEEVIDSAKIKYDVPGLFKCDYSGHINKEGKPHGRGTARFENGNVFTGYWNNGNMAEGTYTYSSTGDVYSGKFVNNKFSQGTIKWAKDNYYFTGQFLNGQPDYNNGHEYNSKGVLIK